MIRPLRRLHVGLWMALAVLLPVGMVAAVLAIPDPAVGDLPRPLAPALAEVVAAGESADATFRIRRDPSTDARQLEVFVRRPLAVASLVIHAVSEDDAAAPGPVIGTLGPRGLHRFPMPEGVRAMRLRLRDPIRGTDEGEIVLEPVGGATGRADG